MVPENVQLMSPSNQPDPLISGIHTQPPHTSSHLFVAFESDEEDTQQYDLLPISNPVVVGVGSSSAVSRNLNQGGPHGSSQGVIQAPGGVSQGHFNHHLHHPGNNLVVGGGGVRNRYFESGSGDEEVVDLAVEEENNNEDNDNNGLELVNV